MAVKKTQMYRRNLDGTETRLNPLTEAQYVSMENGQTVQEILSDRDSDKYTPVITNSSSTFKVGQGDNVDLSSSMKEGAYNSCVLKGKTMVNCIQESSSKDVVLSYEFADGRCVTINDTKESGALGVELKGQTLVNLVPKKIIDYTASSDWDGYHQLVQNSKQSFDEWRALQDLKPNTKYYISCFVETFKVVNNEGYCLNNPSVESIFGDSMIVNGVGRYQWLSTTKSELTNEIFMALRCQNALARGAIKIRDIMIIEYQQGMENWNIPYFEGMASCKMPILHTVGKNLITQSFINTLCNLDNWEGTGAYRNNRKAGELLALFPSNSYVTQVPALTIPANFYPIIYLSYEDESSVSNGHILGSGLYNNNTDSEIVCPERQWRFSVNSKNVVVRGYVNNWNQENMNKLKTVMTQNIQMETGTTTTTYEQGKSSILSLPEEVVLRNIGSVKDTLNLNTGDYIQRIGEVVLDGSEDEKWTLHQISSYTTHTRFEFGLRSNNKPLGIVHTELKCDRFTWINGDVETEHIKIDGGNARSIFLYIQNSKLATQDVSGLRVWLSQNPTIIQYQLETPIVTKINLPSTLKSWNTTTHIYSEIPENTLYPILTHSNPTYPVILKPSTKYSIVANSYGNSHTNSPINFNLGGATASTTVGNRVTTITTPSTLSNELLTMSGRGNKLNNVMVIEGDVAGDEPYFEGICDSKSPILSNFYNVHALSSAVNQDWGVPRDMTVTISTGQLNYHSCPPINVTSLRQKRVYVGLARDGAVLHKHSDFAIYFDSLGQSLGSRFDIDENGTVIPQEATYMRLMNRVGNQCTLDYIGRDEYFISPVKFNVGDKVVYKSNTTTFNQKDDKTIVLRSLPNGVCDTLNVETGEHVQRIGEVVFDGSSDEVMWFNTGWTNGECVACYWNVNAMGLPNKKPNVSNMVCDSFPTATSSIVNTGGNITKEGIWGEVGSSVMYISIKKTKLTELNVTGFRQWASQNPITVQYELVTPVVTTIDIQGFPYAYTSGHVQLSSGHSGQSLTPKVEYSLSANKTEQINSNTKRVTTHQKQLDDFESMMLTSMVQSVYDKAILQFDYEMQMMSLGGE